MILARCWVSIALLLMPLALGCGFSNKLLPLRGEDPAALELSVEHADLLEQTGATMAMHRLRVALLSKSTDDVIRLLGPSTMAIVSARAREAGKTAQDLVRQGAVPGMSLPDQEDPLGALRADGEFSVQETGEFDPTVRKVRLVVQVGQGPEFVVPALFQDDGWKLELVGSLDVDRAAPVKEE